MVGKEEHNNRERGVEERKERIHEDGGESRVNYRDRTGIFFIFIFASPCPQISSSVCPCPYSSPFMSRKTCLSPESVTESGFAGARFTPRSHVSLTFSSLPQR